MLGFWLVEIEMGEILPAGLVLAEVLVAQIRGCSATAAIWFLVDAGDSARGGSDCFIAPDCIVATATPTAVATPAKPVMMIWVEVNGIIDLSVFILIIFVWEWGRSPVNL